MLQSLTCTKKYEYHLDTTKVSILIPVYKTEKYLARCLTSVINQSLREIEIIVIDDHSPDNSIEIIHEFLSKDHRIKLIRNTKNMGLGAARNIGINAATGKYLMFVDSDDWIHFDSCRVLYEVAETHHLQILEGYYSNTDRYIKDSAHYAYSSNYKVYKGDEYLSYYNYVVMIWNKIWLRSFVKEQNLRCAENQYYEEIIFTLPGIIKSDRVARIPFKFYYYYTNPDSIVRQAYTIKHAKSQVLMSKYVKEMYLSNTNKNVEIMLRKELAMNVWLCLGIIRRCRNLENKLSIEITEIYNSILKILGYRFLLQKGVPLYKRILIFISPQLYLKIFYYLIDRKHLRT